MAPDEMKNLGFVDDDISAKAQSNSAAEKAFRDHGNRP